MDNRNIDRGMFSHPPLYIPQEQARQKLWEKLVQGAAELDEATWFRFWVKFQEDSSPHDCEVALMYLMLGDSENVGRIPHRAEYTISRHTIF